jgi:hypothetical protein
MAAQNIITGLPVNIHYQHTDGKHTAATILCVSSLDAEPSCASTDELTLPSKGHVACLQHNQVCTPTRRHNNY